MSVITSLYPPSSPQEGDQWMRESTGKRYAWSLAPDRSRGQWVQVTVSAPEPAPPSSPREGDLWVRESMGRRYVWALTPDRTRGQWVESPLAAPPSNPLDAPIISHIPTLTSAPSPPPAPARNDLWYDVTRGFLFIWYDDGNTIQWVVCNPGQGTLEGPPGQSGLPGLLWQGDWDSLTTYGVNDGVYYQGSSYISLIINSNVTPGTDPATWGLLAQQGATPILTAGANIDIFGVQPNQTIGVSTSPAFTGTPTAPTPTPLSDSSTRIATTAFTQSLFGSATAFFAPINNPVFTGDPQAPTPLPGDDDTSVATTAFVQAAIGAIPPIDLSPYARLAGATFTGTTNVPNTYGTGVDERAVNVSSMAAYLTTGLTFTPGSMLFAGPAGNIVENNSSLFWNNTNVRLGIGTNAPQAPLDIATTQSNVAFYAQIRSASASIALGTFPGADGFIGSLTNSAFELVSNSTPRWQVASTGHLYAFADNVYDIGAIGNARPRNLFVGSAAVIGAASGIPAGGSLANGVFLSGVANFGILYSSGVPTAPAAQGSLCLTDTGITYVRQGTAWLPIGGGASISVGDVAPTAPLPGAMWWKSDIGQLFLYYQDPNTTQWVPAAPAPSMTAAAAVPPGAIMDFAGAAAPTGWYLCNGALVNRTTDSALFAAIGTTYGTGDGSTTFALPDCRGRVTAMVDGGVGLLPNWVLGTAGGETNHALSWAETGSHYHNVNGASHVHTPWYGGGYPFALANGGDGVWINIQQGPQYQAFYTANTAYAGPGTTTDYQGSGAAHNNVQPTIAFNKIIKR